MPRAAAKPVFNATAVSPVDSMGDQRNFRVLRAHVGCLIGRPIVHHDDLYVLNPRAVLDVVACRQTALHDRPDSLFLIVSRNHNGQCIHVEPFLPSISPRSDVDWHSEPREMLEGLTIGLVGIWGCKPP